MADANATRHHETLVKAGCPDDLCKECPPLVAADLAMMDPVYLAPILSLAGEIGPPAWLLIGAVLDALRQPPAPEPPVGRAVDKLAPRPATVVIN